MKWGTKSHSWWLVEFRFVSRPFGCRVLSQGEEIILGVRDKRSTIVEKEECLVFSLWDLRDSFQDWSDFQLSRESGYKHTWDLYQEIVEDTCPQTERQRDNCLFFWFKFIYVNWRLITLQYCTGFAIHLFIYFYLNLIIFNWSIITLQCCVGFCHISKWISHRYVY